MTLRHAAANVRQSLGDAATRNQGRTPPPPDGPHTPDHQLAAAAPCSHSYHGPGLGDAAPRDRSRPPTTPEPADEPMSPDTISFLAGCHAGIRYAVSIIEPLVEDDPENAVPAIREALKRMSQQPAENGSQPSG